MQPVLSHSSYMATLRVQKLGFISILTFNISQNCFIEKDENQLQFLFAGNIKLKYFAKQYFICIIKTSVAGTSFVLSVRRNCSGGGLVSTFSAASPYHLKLNQPFFLPNNSHGRVSQLLLHLRETNGFSCESELKRLVSLAFFSKLILLYGYILMHWFPEVLIYSRDQVGMLNCCKSFTFRRLAFCSLLAA